MARHILMCAMLLILQRGVLGSGLPFCYYTQSNGALSKMPTCTSSALPSSATFKVQNVYTQKYLSYTSSDKNPKMRSLSSSGASFRWGVKLSINETSLGIYLAQAGGAKLNVEYPGGNYKQGDACPKAILSAKTDYAKRRFDSFCISPPDFVDLAGEGYALNATGVCTLSMKRFCPTCDYDFSFSMDVTGYTKNGASATYTNTPIFASKSSEGGQMPDIYWMFIRSS